MTHEHSESEGCCGHHDHGHDHDHDHGHGHSHIPSAPGALSKALLVTLTFMVVEAVGGYFANSLALISDAGHMLTDAGAMLLSLFVFWLSRRPYSHRMSYGYHRAEILGALTSGLAIWLLAGLLVYEAIRRLSAPPEVNGPIVLVVASIGLVANLVGMRFLHKAGEHNLNVKAAYLHMISDLLGSVGAVIAGIVLSLTGWRPIDLIITFIFSGLMLFSSWELVKESVGILMESSPKGVDPAKVLKELEAIEGVKEVHDLHIWTLTSGRLSLSVHIVTIESDHKILTEANRLLQERYGIIHTTIQVEDPSKFSSERCYDCAHD